MTAQVNRSQRRFSRFLQPWGKHSEASPGESIRIERVISVVRLFLAAIAMIPLALDLIDPPGYAPVARVLLIIFTAHSLAAALVLRSQPQKSPVFVQTTYAIDVAAAAMTLPLASHSLPFFVFVLFVIASTAFRWGFRETTILTASTILLVALFEAASAFASASDMVSVEDPNRLAVRMAYVLIMGLLVGYLSEEARLLRAESAAVVGLLGRIRVDVNVTRALATVGHETVRIFDASHLLVVVEELDNQLLFRWSTVGGWSLAPAAISGEPSVIGRPAYFFGEADHSMAIVRRQWPWSSQASCETLTLDPAGHLVSTQRVTVPDAFVLAHPFRRLIMAPVRFGNEWAGRIFIFEPQLSTHLIELTEFLQTLIRQVSPAVFSVYLQNRLRARAGALERARVARELHDGVIQSLIGVEMQIEVLRNQKPLRDSPAAGELLRMQHLVRNEVLNLRDLMQQMRPAEFDPDELLDHFADMVQRFGRDTGIHARFLTDLKAVALERQVCFELVRIVQEGLANIRKHSAATHVVVRFGVSDGAWRLEIDDDGRGFPFEGRLSDAELDASGGGPAIIRERVRAIGGQLAIDSTPGRGSRLEVLVRQESRG